MRTNPRASFMAAVAAALARHSNAAATVDLSWHAPNATFINNLTQVIGGSGIYGYIYDSSETPDEEYGIYNWCNMPHVRKTEYKKPSSEYKLQYVELVSFRMSKFLISLLTFNLQIHRHHKRTVYASNAFPVESYGWDCNDEGLFYYGKPFPGKKPAHTYWQGYISPVNPFVPSGFIGTCQFPQITSGGLGDSWQHGKDLYEVYHDLLGFLPDDANEKATFRVTNNQITSQVAGMVINGMFGIEEDHPLLIQVGILQHKYQTQAEKFPRPVVSTLWNHNTAALYHPTYSMPSNLVPTGRIISQLHHRSMPPWMVSLASLQPTRAST